jgi:hypothetical protein
MKTSNSLKVWKAALGAFVVFTTSARAVLITFDNASDLTDNFLIRQFDGQTGWTYEWTGETGVGGSGAVVRDPLNNSTSSPVMFYNGETFNPLLGGEPLQISVYFQVLPGTTTAASRNFVGFASTDTQNLSVDSNKLGARIFKNGSTSFTLQVQSGSGGSTSSINLGDAFSLVENDWYQLVFQVSRTGTNTFETAASLWNYGPDGTSSPMLIASGSQGFTNNVMGADTSWVAGVMLQNSFGGAWALDNFAVNVVPEPASAGLLTEAIGGLLGMRGRKPFRIGHE